MNMRDKELLSMVFTSVFVFLLQILNKIKLKLKSVKNSVNSYFIDAKRKRDWRKSRAKKAASIIEFIRSSNKIR